jgi:hypothetical protein
MAHPKRAGYVRELLPQLGHPEVVWDTQGSRWETGRRAWATFDPTHNHHTVIQDDSVPCRHFLTHLDRALLHTPAVPLVLYAGATMRDRFKTVPRNASFVVLERIWWGVGISLPTPLIPQALEWADSEEGDQYDHRLSSFFEAMGIPIWYTWPSLVDHRNGPSLIPGRGGGRHAYNPAGRRTQLKWTGKVVDLSNKLVE